MRALKKWFLMMMILPLMSGCATITEVLIEENVITEDQKVDSEY